MGLWWGYDSWVIVLKLSEHAHKKTTARVVFMYGAPREIRTPDQLVRSQLLYPAELWALI